MELPTIVSIASLAFAMAVQVAVTSFLLGGLFNRVRQLEAQDAKRIDLKPELTALTATLVALDKRVGELKTDTHDQIAELGHLVRNRLMGATGVKA